MDELEIVKKIIESKAITIRDVDNGESPFIYSSGNQGPGYIMIKGLCGQPKVMHYLIDKLADKVSKICPSVDYIDGNVTGGVISGWELRNKLSTKLNRDIPFVYLRGSRKRGGHDELITGIHNNPLIKKGMEVIVVEELVNYGTTTVNAVEVFRNHGYIVNYAATVLSYNHKHTQERLKKNNITLIPLITLDRLLEVALQNNLFKKELVDSYTNFLHDSTKWQLDRNMIIPEELVHDCYNKGYNMVKISSEDKLHHKHLQAKFNQGVLYYKKAPPLVFVALDCYNPTDLYNNIKKIKNVENIGFKINLDSLLLDHTMLHYVETLNKPIFADIKMWNGERTMLSILEKCITLNIDIVNVYAHVGVDVLSKLAKKVKGTNTKLFALTVLTHYDDSYTNQLYGKNMEQSIKMLADWADKAECDGIILPAKYLYLVKDYSLLKLCPGIRPLWYNNKTINNQKQIDTPANAVKNGAQYLVVGSPVMKSNNPLESLNLILDEISN